MSQQQQGLFSSNPFTTPGQSQGTTTSVFGNTNQQSGGLFGQQTNQQAGGGLFSQQPQQQQPKSGGIFPNLGQQNQSQQGGLFGNIQQSANPQQQPLQTQQQQLFPASAGTQQQGIGQQLGPGQQQPATSVGIFSQARAGQPASTGIFGGQQQQTNLFSGNNQPASSPLGIGILQPPQQQQSQSQPQLGKSPGLNLSQPPAQNQPLFGQNVNQGQTAQTNTPAQGQPLFSLNQPNQIQSPQVSLGQIVQGQTQQAPQVSAPQVQAPLSQAPQVQSPLSQAPQVQAPQSQTPSSQAPQSQTLGQILPQSTQVQQPQGQQFQQTGQLSQANQGQPVSTPQIQQTSTQLQSNSQQQQTLQPVSLGLANQKQPVNQPVQKDNVPNFGNISDANRQQTQGTTPPILQPQVQQQQQRPQPQVKQTPIEMPDVNLILREIVHSDSQKVVKLLQKKEIQERIILNTNFYKTQGPEQQGIQVGANDQKGQIIQQLRQIIFENKMPVNQMDCLYSCLKYDSKQKLEIDFKDKDKKGNLQFSGRQFILTHLIEQRLLILQCITKLLDKLCYVDESVYQIKTMREELQSLIVEILKIKVQDPNDPTQPGGKRSLLEHLVVSFGGAEKQLEFYMNHLNEHSQYVKWQVFNALAHEQLEIVKIFILVSFYYSQLQIPEFGKNVISLLNCLKSTKLVGIVNSKSIFTYLSDQNHVLNLQSVGEQIKIYSTFLILSLAKLPENTDFVGNPEINQYLIMRETKRYTQLDGIPGFMVFYFNKTLLNELCTQVPLLVHALGNLKQCLKTSERETYTNLVGTDRGRFDQAFNDIDQIQNDQRDQGRLFDELNILVNEIPQNLPLCYAVQRTIQQFICMYVLARLSNDIEIQNYIELTEIWCKLLKNNNLFVGQFWLNYDYNQQALSTGDVFLVRSIREQDCYLKVLSCLIGTNKFKFESVAQNDHLQIIVELLSDQQDERGYKFQINPLIKFALESRNQTQSQDGYERSSQPSMDYYTQNYNETLLRQSKKYSKFSENDIQDIQNVLYVIKFMERLCQSDASKLQILEYSLGLGYIHTNYWPTLLILFKSLSSSISLSYLALQEQNKRAEELVTTLFRVKKHLLRTINALLLNEHTSQITAYTIGLFGFLSTKSTPNQFNTNYKSAQLHPLLELQDLISKFQQSQTIGVNPYLEQKVCQSQSELLSLVYSFLQFHTPTEYFPPHLLYMDRNENNIEAQLEILQQPLQEFLRSFINQQYFNQQGEQNTRNFPEMFESVLKKLLERRQGVRTELLQNLLDAISRQVLLNYPKYLNRGTQSSFEVLTKAFEIVNTLLTLQISNSNPIFTQPPQQDNQQQILRQILLHGLNCIDSEQLLSVLLNPLDTDLGISFFEEVGQESVGPRSVRPVGLINQLWSSIQKHGVEQSLRRQTYELIISSLATLTQLLRLVNQSDANEISVVQLLKSKLVEKQLYFYKSIWSSTNTIYHLSIIHALIACLNMKDFVYESTNSLYYPSVNTRVQNAYEQLEIRNEDPLFRIFITHKGLTRSKEPKSDIIIASLTCLSQFALTFNQLNLEERFIEDLIIQLKGEIIQKVCPVKHTLSQFNTTLMRILESGDYGRIVSVLEFIHICIANKQTTLNQLIRPQGQNTGGVELFLLSLSSVCSKDTNCSILERQHLNFLIVSLIHELLERENKFSKFSELIREKAQKNFIDILLSILDGIREPLSPLANIQFILDDLKQNESIGMLLQNLFEQTPQEQIQQSDAFEQLIYEYSTVGAIDQVKSLDYFLRILCSIMKSNDTSKNQLTSIIKDFFSLFQQWCDALIQVISLSDTVQNFMNHLDEQCRTLGVEVQIQKIQDEPWAYLEMNLFGPGRDNYIDSNEFLSALRSQNTDIITLERLLCIVQRVNMLQGLYSASTQAFQQVYATLQLVVASGIDGTPLSCTNSNFNTFGEGLKSVLSCFNRGNKQLPKSEFEEKFAQACQLGKSIISPNYQQVLIPGGLIGVITNESQRDQKSIFNTWRKLLALTQRISESLTNIMNQGEDLGRLNNMVPVMWTLMELYSALSLLLGFQSSNYDTDSNENSIKIINNQKDLFLLSRGQLQFWVYVASQVNNKQNILRDDTQEALLQGFYYLMALLSKASSKISTTDLYLFQDSVQKEYADHLPKAISGLTICTGYTMEKLGVYILSYALKATSSIFPALVRDFLLQETEQYDCTKLLLNRIRTPQNENIYYQAVVTTWISLCQDTRYGLTKYLLVQRNILEVLRNHPNFLQIKDEQVYAVHSDGIIFTQNYKHIMWCYTLILVREGCFADMECLKLSLDFINHHRQRIISCLLSLDHNKSYLQLQLFTQGTQLTFPQVQMQQPGLQYLTELHLTLMLLATLIHSSSLKIHFPAEYDKISYWVCNLVPAQLGAIKRTKFLFAFIKPFSQLETKLNQQDLAADGVSQEGKQQLSPRSSRNLATMRGSFNKDGYGDRSGFLKSQSAANTATHTVRLDQELLDLNPFQLLTLLEFTNVLQAAGLSLSYTLRFKDLTAARASQCLPLEPNYWSDLGDNIVRYIHLNMEILVNISRFGNLQSLMNYCQLVNNSLDYQIQQGGLNMMSSYPKSRQALKEQLVINIVLGLESALLHLGLRDIYRQIRFVRDSIEMEIVFTKKICQLIDMIIQEKEIMCMDKDFLTNIYSHSDTSEHEYWQQWRENFTTRLSR